MTIGLWISRLRQVHFFGFAQFTEGSDRVGQLSDLRRSDSAWLGELFLHLLYVSIQLLDFLRCSESADVRLLSESVAFSDYGGRDASLWDDFVPKSNFESS